MLSDKSFVTVHFDKKNKDSAETLSSSSTVNDLFGKVLALLYCVFRKKVPLEFLEVSTNMVAGN